MVVLSLASLGGCARRALPPVDPARYQMAGDTGVFGPGPVAMSDDGREMVFELTRAANVWFYNAHDNGWVELLRSDALRPGRTTVTIPWNALDARVLATAVMGGLTEHPRLRYRDALVVVMWERGVNIEPRTIAGGSFAQFQSPRAPEPASIPAMMFGDRRVRWISYSFR
jgi:hypothetical protein